MKSSVLLFVCILFFSCHWNKKLQQTHSDNPKEDRKITETMHRDIVNLSFNMARVNSRLDQNFVISPVLTYQALLPVYIGSAGKTKSEFQKIYTLDKEWKDLDKNQISWSYQEKSDTIVLETANAVWLDQRYDFLDDYVKTVKEKFGFSLFRKDFSDLQFLAGDINQFISGQTRDYINELIGEDELVNSRLVIANALYFQALWQNTFDHKNTRDGEFQTGKGKVQKIPFMNQKGKFLYYENELFEVLQLDFIDGAAAFMGILPKENVALAKAIAASQETYFMMDTMMGLRNLNVYLPRITIQQQTDLNESFKQLGIVDAFSESADLSGMTGNTDLYLDKVKQAITLMLDEEGAEATAANVVVIKEKGGSLSQEIRFNKPFYFYIKDLESKVILLSGIITHPAKN